MNFQAIIENALLYANYDLINIKEYGVSITVDNDYLELFYENRAKYIEQLFQYNSTNMCFIDFNDAKIFDVDLSINAYIYVGVTSVITGNIICYKTSCCKLSEVISAFKAEYYKFSFISELGNNHAVFNNIEYMKIHDYYTDMWSTEPNPKFICKILPNLIGYDNSVYVLKNNALLNSFTIECITNEFIVTAINTEHELFDYLDLIDEITMTIDDYLAWIINQGIKLTTDSVRIEKIIDAKTTILVLNKNITDFSWRKLIKNANK